MTNTADRWEITVYGSEPQTFSSVDRANVYLDEIKRYPVTEFKQPWWLFGLAYPVTVWRSPSICLRQWSILLPDKEDA